MYNDDQDDWGPDGWEDHYDREPIPPGEPGSPQWEEDLLDGNLDEGYDSESACPSPRRRPVERRFSELRRRLVLGPIMADPRTTRGAANELDGFQDQIEPLGVNAEVARRLLSPDRLDQIDDGREAYSSADLALIYGWYRMARQLERVEEGLGLVARRAKNQGTGYVMVDVGCGPVTGYSAFRSMAEGGRGLPIVSYLGIDCSRGMRDLGRAIADAWGAGPSVHLAPAWTQATTGEILEASAAQSGVIVCLSYLFASLSVNEEFLDGLAKEIDVLDQKLGKGRVTILYQNSTNENARPQRWDKFAMRLQCFDCKRDQVVDERNGTQRRDVVLRNDVDRTQRT